MKKLSLHAAALLRNLPVILFPLIFLAREMQSLAAILFIVIALLEIGALLLYRFLKKEQKDEMADSALMKADSLCFKLACLVMIFAAVIFLRDYQWATENMGWIIAVALSAITLINLVLFSYFDKKGNS